MNDWATLYADLKAIATGKPGLDGGEPLGPLTKDNLPDSDSVPTAPLDYQAAFTKLWHGQGGEGTTARAD